MASKTSSLDVAGKIPSLREALRLRSLSGLPPLNTSERPSWYSLVVDNSESFVDFTSRGFTCMVCLESSKARVHVSATCGHLLCSDCFPRLRTARKCPTCQRQQVWHEIESDVSNENLTLLLLCTYPGQKMYFEPGYRMVVDPDPEPEKFNLESVPRGIYQFCKLIPIETGAYKAIDLSQALSYSMLLSGDLESEYKIRLSLTLFPNRSGLVRDATYSAICQLKLLLSESDQNYKEVQFVMLKNAIFCLRDGAETAEAKRRMLKYLERLKPYKDHTFLPSCDIPNFELESHWHEYWYRKSNISERFKFWESKESELTRRFHDLYNEATNSEQESTILKWYSELLDKIYMNYRIINDRAV